MMTKTICFAAKTITKTMKRLISILIILVVVAVSSVAQEGVVDDYDAYTLAVEARLAQFNADMEELGSYVGTASSAGIVDLKRNFNSLDVRWNTYCSAQQGYIADKEVLLAIVAQYQQTRQMVSDSIDHCSKRLNAEKLFGEVQAFMLSELPEYDALLRKCLKFSATDKTAPQLERLQASEQLLFNEITTKYLSAKEAVTLNSSLKNKEQALDELYLDLSTKSAEVQAAQYKPFIERIKDYLLGIAAVALVLMFVSMIQNKIVATKQMKESLKKLKEQYIKDGQDEIPSI